MGSKILPGATLVTDSLGGYPSLAESCKAKHVQIPSKKHKKEIFNIQLINYYHSSLKGMTNIRFRGVATKYLNNYIVYNNFVTFAKESFMEKIKILKNEIFTFRVEKRSYSANISKENRYLYSRINTYSEQSQKNVKCVTITRIPGPSTTIISTRRIYVSEISACLSRNLSPFHVRRKRSCLFNDYYWQRC